jgi:hypothetical protein
VARDAEVRLGSGAVATPQGEVIEAGTRGSTRAEEVKTLRPHWREDLQEEKAQEGIDRRADLNGWLGRHGLSNGARPCRQQKVLATDYLGKSPMRPRFSLF